MSEENLQPKPVSEETIKAAISENLAPMQQGEKKLIIPDESYIPKKFDYCSPTVQDRLISEELINRSNRTGDELRKKKKKANSSSD
jgi:hypothetical protein